MAAEYGAFERKVARMLSRFPLLKYWIKQGYARAAYALAKRGTAESTATFPVHEVGPPELETFFGYYDKSPLSGDGWLLCHASRGPSHKPPVPGLTAEVHVYDFSERPLRRPAMSCTTSAFNWQQGARAHWLDGRHFIFNDFNARARRYEARVVSAASRSEIARYVLPVQDSWRTEYFLSIDYRRLQSLRPDYGYCNLPPLDDDALSRLDDDGIWRVDLSDGRQRLLYSLRQVCEADPEDDFAGAVHKVNHVMISPDGRRFIFLHRRFVGRRKFDRLMLGDAEGARLRVLCATGMVSHCFWIDGNSLLCYLRGPAGRDGYHVVDCDSGSIRSWFNGRLDTLGDGHPHVCGDWFVTDSYPDKRRMQHLVKANLRTGAVLQLGEFLHGFRYSGVARCDLHPRLSPDGRWAFFDSVRSGRRRLNFMDTRLHEE
jgi:hypothetical protein